MWRNIIDKELPICYSIENERRELWNGTLWSPVNSDAAVNQWLLEFMNPVRLETVQERIRNMKLGESLLVAQFGSMLRYKCALRSKPLFEVDAAYTSQICSKCGSIH